MNKSQVRFLQSGDFSEDLNEVNLEFREKHHSNQIEMMILMKCFHLYELMMKVVIDFGGAIFQEPVIKK